MPAPTTAAPQLELLEFGQNTQSRQRSSRRRVLAFELRPGQLRRLRCERHGSTRGSPTPTGPSAERTGGRNNRPARHRAPPKPTIRCAARVPRRRLLMLSDSPVLNRGHVTIPFDGDQSRGIHQRDVFDLASGRRRRHRNGDHAYVRDQVVLAADSMAGKRPAAWMRERRRRPRGSAASRVARGLDRGGYRSLAS